MADERTERRYGSEGESDHDRIVRMDQILKGIDEKLADLVRDNRTLMNDRAKLIGICVGASAMVSAIVKIFWPR